MTNINFNESYSEKFDHTWNAKLLKFSIYVHKHVSLYFILPWIKNPSLIISYCNILLLIISPLIIIAITFHTIYTHSTKYMYTSISQLETGTHCFVSYFIFIALNGIIKNKVWFWPYFLNFCACRICIY